MRTRTPKDARTSSRATAPAFLGGRTLTVSVTMSCERATLSDTIEKRLAARRVVDWSGPHGWTHSATNLGRTAPLDTPPPGTKAETLIARQRRVLPLSEFRVGFTVECAGLQDAERGATDVDYTDLDRATYEAALIENRAVFHGWPDAGIIGIAESSAHHPVSLGKGADTYPHAVARAVEPRVSAAVVPVRTAAGAVTLVRYLMVRLRSGGRTVGAGRRSVGDRAWSVGDRLS